MSTTKTSALKAYWRRWLWSDMATRIITVNCIVWLIITIGLLAMPRIANWWVGLFAVPNTIYMLPSRIWTVGTYMISQYDFMHLLVNMLWLLLFGRVMAQAAGDRHVLGGYVCGGLAGAAAYIIMSLFLTGGPMIGASCAVLAVIGMCLALTPNWQVNLLLFGVARIKWIALAAILLFVLEPGDGWADWACHNIPHLAGLGAGLAYGLWLKRGGDWQVSVPRERPGVWAPVPENKANPNTATAYTRPVPPRQRRPETQAELEDQLDTLLDKVNRSGYGSLTPAERQRLFELSQKIKR